MPAASAIRCTLSWSSHCRRILLILSSISGDGLPQASTAYPSSLAMRLMVSSSMSAASALVWAAGTAPMSPDAPAATAAA
eukprot:5211116-Heterocapsa_arctica.AAC.1